MNELKANAMTPEILGLDHYVKENARLTMLNNELFEALTGLLRKRDNLADGIAANTKAYDLIYKLGGRCEF